MYEAECFLLLQAVHGAICWCEVRSVWILWSPYDSTFAVGLFLETEKTITAKNTPQGATKDGCEHIIMGHNRGISDCGCHNFG